MTKKKFITIISIIVVLIMVTIIGVLGIKVTNDKKVNNFIQLGISYLTEENYDKAKLEFSNALSINNKYEEASDLLKLTESYVKIKNLYADKEYALASELISEIKKNPYLIHIETSVNKLSLEVDKKVSIINEINTMDSQIEKLIGENKYSEATDLINKYLREDLKEEYINKLNILMNTVNEAKVLYEKEQSRIAEEKRLEEERIAEAERKAQEEKRLKEQEKAESTVTAQEEDLSSKMISEARVKEILDFRIENNEITFENYDSPIVFKKNEIVYWAYEQIWQARDKSFLIIDMFTGKIIISEKLDFIHGNGDFYYPGY